MPVNVVAVIDVDPSVPVNAVVSEDEEDPVPVICVDVVEVEP